MSTLNLSPFSITRNNFPLEAQITVSTIALVNITEVLYPEANGLYGMFFQVEDFKHP